MSIGSKIGLYFLVSSVFVLVGAQEGIANYEAITATIFYAIGSLALFLAD